MRCAACGTENPGGRKFCGGCGAPLARPCPACGAPNEPQFAFCGECGAALGVGAPAAAGAPAPGPPVAERRLVSVLFADLVGFTTLSEARDPEDVRELLSRYFDTCRELVGRYGGTVEKFIGDAVMAVWGTPVTNEDDAERAVRAALDIVAAVSALGREVGVGSLRARAGVLTGEAAVNLGAVGEGMVAGDLVNSAARIQGVAEPGTVLVGEATRRATEAAVVYGEAGSHELKGKAEPVQLWRAERVVAGRGGAQKSAGLEAPFVGRDRELRLVKELFHASATQRGAHLLSVTGSAGIGKSRLTWEFFKYVDGLSETVFWHRGRCLAYGEGVTYWALAEMVRARAGIAEEEPQSSASTKLRTMVERFVTDDAERRWVEPRLASVLGLGEQVTADATDLFSGWRLFFERLATDAPVVLVFEDLQWADNAMLDFIEYLLDWSRTHPLFVMTLARPELADRRSGWGVGRRNLTALSLEPLPAAAMDELLAGLVPGLPEEIRSRIRDRAEGMPLYAVETVRMLLDRGALRREGDRYVPVADVGELDVPETLHALIAARLDGLPAAERALLQDAAVLGKTFTAAALASLSDRTEQELAPLLATLVRKELLAVQADPRSPERGQYGFLQALVQKVAHDTLSRRDRKGRHLAVADYLRRTWSGDEGEIVEVVASHYLDAYLADPAAGDAEQIREQARVALTRAGERAASLAAKEEAHRYFLRAAELVDDPAERARLLLQAGIAARTGGRSPEAQAAFEESRRLFESVPDQRGAALATAEIAHILWWEKGRLDEAVDLLRGSYRVLSAGEPDAVVGRIGAELGRFLYFGGHRDEAFEVLERTLPIAEAHRMLAVLSEAMNTKSLVLQSYNRIEESLGLVRHALQVALDSGVAPTILRAYVNLSSLMHGRDQSRDALEYVHRGLALARTVGDRGFEWFLLSHVVGHSFWLGEWDDVEAAAAEIPDWREVPDARSAFVSSSEALLVIAIARGRTDDLRRVTEGYGDTEVADLQRRAGGLTAAAFSASAAGDHELAGQLARRVIDECGGTLTRNHPHVKQAHVLLLDSAMQRGDLAEVDQVVGSLESAPPGLVPPFLHAQAARFRARLAAQRGEDARVEDGFRTAEGTLAQVGLRFFLAQVRLELGEWLLGQDRGSDAEPLLAAARETFERLRATVWLDRLDQLRARVRVPA